MTPPAATAAARRRAATPARKSRPPRPPRRVSGPRGGVAAAAAVALPRHAPRPQAPSRRPVAVPRQVRRPELPLGVQALERLRALPDHRLLDRLIGGRVWIVLIGTLLAGIVTLQLSLLKLNAGISHAVERSAVLQQENALLRAANSRWSDPAWVVEQARRRGFVMPPQGSARFLAASPDDAGRALTVMRLPQQQATADATTTTTTTTPGPAAAPATTTTTPLTTPPTGTATTPVPAATPSTAPTSSASPGGASVPTR